MKTMVSANAINKQVMRFTALIAAATLLIGPALAADPQMLTNTSLPVNALSERQTRRLLSGANLKAKMKSAMRLAKKGLPNKTEPNTPALAMKTAGGAAASPTALTDSLRPPLTLNGSSTGSSETTAPGWQDDPDALSTTPAAPVATTPVAVTPAAPVATTPVAVTPATPVDTTPVDTTPVAVTPAAPVDTTPATTPVAATPEPATTATIEPAAPAAGSPVADNAASTDVSASTDASAGDAAANTAGDTTASVATTKQGEFTVPTALGTGIITSESKPGALAMSPAMGDAMITGSPAFTQVGDGPIVIDNDEMVEQTVSIAYEEMPTTEGQTAVKAGARFPVVMMSEINSKTAKKGDPIECRLKYDLKIGNRHIAIKGSRVRGHLNYALKARTVLGSVVTMSRFYRNSGVLGLEFDELINEKGEHFKLAAKPAMMDRIIKNKYEGRELGVNHNGQVVGPFSQQLRYKAIRVGMNFAMAPLGAFSFGAMPVALGVIGAANPSFAFMKPVGLNVRHRRIKGFAWGFLSGIPGSWLIEDTTVRGQEAIIKPGDEFLAIFNEQFNGEAMTDAEMLPGAGSKVKGEVLSGVKEKKKK